MIPITFFWITVLSPKDFLQKNFSNSKFITNMSVRILKTWVNQIVVFLKKILMQMPHTDNHLMRHLLIGLLISYKKYRKYLEYHGNINQTSIIGVDNEKAELYPNNTRGDYYDKDGRLKSVNTGKTSGQQHLDMDLYDFKYRLIYSHVNMLTVKEWLNLRTIGLERKAR